MYSSNVHTIIEKNHGNHLAPVFEFFGGGSKEIRAIQKLIEDRGHYGLASTINNLVVVMPRLSGQITSIRNLSTYHTHSSGKCRTHIDETTSHVLSILQALKQHVTRKSIEISKRIRGVNITRRKINEENAKQMLAHLQEQMTRIETNARTADFSESLFELSRMLDEIALHLSSERCLARMEEHIIETEKEFAARAKQISSAEFDWSLTDLRLSQLQSEIEGELEVVDENFNANAMEIKNSEEAIDAILWKFSDSQNDFARLERLLAEQAVLTKRKQELEKRAEILEQQRDECDEKVETSLDIVRTATLKNTDRVRLAQRSQERIFHLGRYFGDLGDFEQSVVVLREFHSECGGLGDSVRHILNAIEVLGVCCDVAPFLECLLRSLESPQKAFEKWVDCHVQLLIVVRAVLFEYLLLVKKFDDV